MENNIIKACRKVVAEKQYTKVDGMLLDLFTASAILTVFDNISEDKQVKFTSCSLQRMAEMSFQLLEKCRA